MAGETIIDETYFEVGNIYIPNNKDVNAEPTSSPSAITELQHFISVYERELLFNALGVVLYDSLIDHIENEEIQTRWSLLIKGETYVNANGDSRRWIGLDGGKNKQSVLAFYVFTEYLRNDHETYATVGTVKNTAKNAEIINATPKFIKAYNRFIKGYQGGCNPGDGVVVVNGFGSLGFDYYDESEDVSWFTYMTEKNELEEVDKNKPFPDFKFKFYGNQNSFGI